MELVNFPFDLVVVELCLMDAYRNGVANRADADLVLVSDLMVRWCFLCLSLFE